jgi:hypothetical protein
MSLPSTRTPIIRPRVRAGLVAGTVLLAAGVTATNLGSGTAATTPPRLTHEQVAKALLEHRGRFLSAGAVAGLRYAAGETGRTTLIGEGDEGDTAARGAAVSAAAPSAGVRNVRVNDPRTDPFIDQTTQSETTVAVHGNKVAVGYNDSSHIHPAGLTAAGNLTGYSYSTDGGRTFTDGGTLPFSPGYIHFGDPWLGSDRAGGFYYSTLSLDATVFNLEIGVSTSSDGGRRWTRPTIASPGDPQLFYSGDKEALTVGRSKTSAAKDTVYVAWDDFVYDPRTDSGFNGLPVARSEDGGATWALSYADRFVGKPDDCSFGQYIGSQPVVDATDGTLYVVSLKIAVDDPTCAGGTPAFTEVSFRSDDGGKTFGPGTTIATVGDFADIGLGRGKAARSLPLPTAAMAGGALVVAWNEGAKDASRILWSASSDRAQTWSPTVPVPAASGEDFQPALSTDAKGLHLAYYHKYPDNTVDVLLGDSATGAYWSTKRITTAPFPGVYNSPQFDPFIADAYLGDYIANVSSGGRQYLAWGDNRGIVRNVLWPSGRNDPDVFFARR